MRRRSLSRRSSRKIFRKGAKHVKRANFGSAHVMRGGIRF